MATPRPTLFCLHYLAGSAQSWRPLAARLSDTHDCVPIDLPGFGNAAGLPGYSVADMADHVAHRIRAASPARWSLAGHSMGGKIATVLARRAEDGEAGLAGLESLVLLAASPPSPEPMPASKRTQMLAMLGEHAAAGARRFIDDNVAGPLPPAEDAQAIADVLRTNRAAWTAWLEHGSREDWAERVGVLNTPALILAGEQDAALGPAAQLRATVPHFARYRFVTLPGACHLLPLERPDDVAALITGTVPLAPAYRALIDGPRTSTRTRQALLARTVPDGPGYQPATLTPAQLTLLRLVLDRVLPQPGPGAIDLAARIEPTLAQPSDGWRFATLPPRPRAWSAALDGLAAQGFAEASPPAQDAMLEALAGGKAHGFGSLDASQLRQWFEDVRAEAVRHFVAHPSTLARMGYSGIAYGGDGPGKPGFHQIGTGQRDPWEPIAP